MLIVIPNHFGKHVNRTSQIMLLEKDKLLSKQKDASSIFNKHFGSTTDLLNLFSWPEDTSMTQLTPLLKNLPFTEV